MRNPFNRKAGASISVPPTARTAPVAEAREAGGIAVQQDRVGLHHPLLVRRLYRLSACRHLLRQQNPDRFPLLNLFPKSPAKS